MGNPANSFDFTVTLTTFLGTSISDGTYDDLLSTLKFDQIGQEAAASDIETAAGQLWSNLSDDYVLATYDSFYLATKTWRRTTLASLSTLGTDDGLLVGDVGYSEGESSLFYALTVDGASTSSWSAMGLTSGSVAPSAGAILITGATAITAVDTDAPGVASVNDYDPGGTWPDTNVIRVDANAGGTTLTGLEVSGNVNCQLVLLVNISATDTISLTHEDAASVDVNRFLNAGNATVAVGTNGSIWLWYDGSSRRWRTV